jgi:hypothetical protein
VCWLGVHWWRGKETVAVVEPAGRCVAPDCRWCEQLVKARRVKPGTTSSALEL